MWTKLTFPVGNPRDSAIKPFLTLILAFWIDIALTTPLNDERSVNSVDDGGAGNVAADDASNDFSTLSSSSCGPDGFKEAASNRSIDIQSSASPS